LSVLVSSLSSSSVFLGCREGATWGAWGSGKVTWGRELHALVTIFGHAGNALDGAGCEQWLVGS
jgi:hypothetical protein